MALPTLKMSMINYGEFSLLAIVLCCFQVLWSAQGQLKVGFYSKTCPSAESTVTSLVKEATSVNPRIPAVLLRLHFHDCFVEGCDGSILVDNVEDPERKAFANQGLDGFGEIETAKAQLEANCPGVVSCADIVALAARDAVNLVETGRRDGRVCNESLAAEIPDVNESIQVLKSKFMKKGLSDKELVLLSGAHTIGSTACFFMTTRLYNFNGKNISDPSINPKFLEELKAKCPMNGDANLRIPLDNVSSQTFDARIFRHIRDGFAVIASDARLYDDNITKRIVDSYVGGSSFLQDFPKAMVKMGQIGVKTGLMGEIRRKCNSFN
ncbi:hypothetical protein RJ639_000487 [Escallonia herrerae]|uniref:Peroxidase n=1 Tax=Escallonia herrerae TaxID=1293975 RepID=A0AA88XC07_9ASTE|nr:hypothetical protein RJ639_000487 [Escallonia herrerae]